MTLLTPRFTVRAMLSCTAVALSVVQPAIAQESTKLSLLAVAPYTAEYDYFLDDDAGAPRKAGHWTDLVTVVDGQLARTVTRHPTTGGVELRRTVIVDQATLAPVRLQQRSGPELTSVFHIEFNGRSMTQILVGDPTRPARIATVELASPVLETGLLGVFTLSLPMEKPDLITVDTYAPGADPKVVPKTFHVVGREYVEVMGQTLETWRVEDRASQWTYWVRKSKPYIVKVVHPFPGGKMATSLVTSYK